MLVDSASPLLSFCLLSLPHLFGENMYPQMDFFFNVSFATYKVLSASVPYAYEITSHLCAG